MSENSINSYLLSKDKRRKVLHTKPKLNITVVIVLFTLTAFQIKKKYSYGCTEKTKKAKKSMNRLYPELDFQLCPKKFKADGKKNKDKPNKRKRSKVDDEIYNKQCSAWRKHARRLFPTQDYLRVALEIASHIEDNQSVSDLAWNATTVCTSPHTASPPPRVQQY